jgi:murein DD-endopeptidase MepM/ murein hydrolase activator NlpD
VSRLPATTGILAATLLMAAPFALAGGDEERTAATSVGVQIIVPGAHTSSTGSSSVGAYDYRDLVSVGSYKATSDTSQTNATAGAELTGISLLGGLVTASSVSVHAAAQSDTTATGTFESTVSGLTVGGVAVPVGPNAHFDLPDGLGYGIVEEQSVASAGSTYRGYGVGLVVHLNVGWHDMPAGTEVRLGYADAGASAAPKPKPTPTDTTPNPPSKPTPSKPAPSKPTPSKPKPPTNPPNEPPATTNRATPRGGSAQSVPVRGGDATIIGGLPTTGTVPVPTGGVLPPLTLPDSPGPPEDTEAPPPGGFTANPPIDPSVQTQLLHGGYVFPVLGAVSYTNDWGAPRSDTGYHQGIDMFASLGAPVVAVHDGQLLAVGWNRLGGHRLWLRDPQGNLFYYAHLSAYALGLHDGSKVHAGQILGFVGNSGDAQGTPYHLHFEIHPQARWAVPPFEYVANWKGNGSTTITAPILGNGTNLQRQAPITAPPRPGSMVPLGYQDISSASGLDPDGVAAAASSSPAPLTEGDGAVIGGAPTPDANTVLTAPTPVTTGTP